MKRTRFALAFFTLTLPANALDGTPSPANVAPAVGKVAPLGYIPNSEYWHNPNLLEQLQRQAQATPGGTPGVDPLIGTWKLNLEKSTYIGIPPPKSQILTSVAGEGRNLINTSETVDDQGRAFKATFLHTYDGMPHPTTNFPGFDASAYNRIGNVLSFARFNKGKQVQVGRGVIDPGKTYTLTSAGIDENNRPYYIVGVYDRQ
jgi:hypothetical protein